jgi:2-keto-3-deoxy-L-rhamnonate aldolase RhmA
MSAGRQTLGSADSPTEGERAPMDLYPIQTGPPRKNRLRELLDNGSPSLGTHLLSTWPTVTELVGQTRRWDYVEFVAEYAPWTMHDLDNLGRAIELFPDFTGMIKIEQHTRGHLAMRAIGSGIQNVLFADIRTAADARECVRAVRAEHPDHRGLHGAGMRRDARTVMHIGSPEWTRALGECVIVLMIEKKEAVQNLDEILSVEGVDMIQFGPADYALSMGWSRADAADSIRETESLVIDKALSRGIQPRAEIGDAGRAHWYLDRGVRHFCIGHDVAILYNWWAEQGALMRTALTDPGGALRAQTGVLSARDQQQA